MIIQSIKHMIGGAVSTFYIIESFQEICPCHGSGLCISCGQLTWMVPNWFLYNCLVLGWD